MRRRTVAAKSGGRSAGELRVCRFQRAFAPHQLSATIASQSSRAATWRMPCAPCDRLVRESVAVRPEAPCERLRKAYPGAVRPRRSASYHRPWPAHRGAAVAGRQPAFRRLAEAPACAAASVGCFLGELAERKGPAAVHHEAVGRLAILGARHSTVGRCSDQHLRAMAAASRAAARTRARKSSWP